MLRLLPTTLTPREIADELFVSLNTVKSHTRTLYRKLGVRNRHAAIEQARDTASCCEPARFTPRGEDSFIPRRRHDGAYGNPMSVRVPGQRFWAADLFGSRKDRPPRTDGRGPTPAARQSSSPKLTPRSRPEMIVSQSSGTECILATADTSGTKCTLGGTRATITPR